MRKFNDISAIKNVTLQNILTRKRDGRSQSTTPIVVSMKKNLIFLLHEKGMADRNQPPPSLSV